MCWSKKEWMRWSKKLQATLSAEGHCSTFDHQEHQSVATFFAVSFLPQWVAFLSNQSIFCRIRWFSWVINSSGVLSNLSNQFSCFTTLLIHIYYLDLWILQKTGATAIEKMRKLNQTMHCNTVHASLHLVQGAILSQNSGQFLSVYPFIYSAKTGQNSCPSGQEVPKLAATLKMPQATFF